VDQAGPFFEQFIDDYFAECEEHLVTIRRVLLQLESEGSIDGAESDALRRALHTVKGLSGMVGLAPVERISHAMEDAVGLIEVDKPPSSRVVELLFIGVRLLEERIQARKRRETVTEAQSYLEDVAHVVAGSEFRSQSGAPGVAPPAPTRLEVAFTPSHELASRGVTIDAVRGRLTERADIESAMPRVHPGGGVYFEFIVQLKPGQALDESWRDDGMSWSELGDERGMLVPVGPDEASRAERPRQTSVANLVRVDLSRLDETMRIVGELVITRSKLQDSVDKLAARVGDAAVEPIAAAADAIERQLRALREGIMRIRLVQIGEVFERMRFAMRDIAREHGKAIHLEFAGGDTELDKVVIDRIVEPLIHLVRNAASHGIESPELRAHAGKTATGQIMLRAHAAGDRIFVEVEDDGAGIDFDRVERRAHERGLLPARASLEPSAVLDVLASPGFSTTESADMASGRGVGMAVVVSTIRGLGGELTVESRSGSGTRFVIELPLTLMIADALLVEIGGQTLAVPQILLREVLDLSDHVITPLENNQVMTYRDSVLPLIDVREVFAVPSPSTAKHVLVVGADGGLQGLIVDRVLGLREIVVQPVSDPYVNVVGVAGATELPDGTVSLILDVPAIVRHHRRRSKAPLGGRPRDAIGTGA
jgi:two-component system, chemotaxis family, sensor kinase CheA